MKITKPDDVLLLQGFDNRAGQPYLIVTLGYAVEPDGSLISEKDAWQWLALQFDDEPFDLGLQKRRGTFAVAGCAHAPEGRPTARMAVRARFAALEKTLHVVGDRVWRRGLAGWHASEPEPFLCMSVDLAHAFGGPDDPANPHGKGRAPAGADPAGTPLPNVEWPDAPVFSIDDRPRVASLGNLPASDPAQAAWAGTFDDAWQARRFPWLPDDTDPRFFDRVAQDQCATAYWRGDERWSVAGMHPQLPLVEGALPGLQPQLLWLRGAQGPWAQAPSLPPQRAELLLDTVWLFPETGRQVLLYRAAIAVAREDAGDVEALWVDTLPAGAAVPALPEQAGAWAAQAPSLAARLLPAAGTGMAAAVPAVAAASTPAAAVQPEAPDAPMPSASGDAGEPALLGQAGDVRYDEQAQDDAVDGGLALQSPAAADAAAPVQPGAGADAAAPAVQSWSDALLDDICADYGAAWEDARQRVQEMEKEQAAYGVRFPEVAPFEPPPRQAIMGGAPQGLSPDFAQALTSEVDAAMAEGRRVFEATVRDALADQPEAMEALLAQADGKADTPPLDAQHMAQILDNLPPEIRERAEAEARAMAEQFEKMDQLMAQTFGNAGGAASDAGDAAAEAAGAAAAMQAGGDAPSAAAVPGADAGAPDDAPAPPDGIAASVADGLPPVNAGDAMAAGGLPAGQGMGATGDAPASADALAASAASASSGAATSWPAAGAAAAAGVAAAMPAITLRGEALEDKDFSHEPLAGADFSGALLTGCLFVGADLSGATFAGARLEGCDFTGAKMPLACLRDADISDTTFRDADWREAQAERASLAACDLSGVDATGADLSQVQLDRCMLDGTCLADATLAGATLSGVHGKGVDFSRSMGPGLRIDSDTRLAGAIFHSAMLAGSSIMRSHFPGSDWQEADVTDALIAECDLSGSQAVRLRARRACFKDSRIVDADWRQADLFEASFDYALLQGVDGSGANLHAAQTRLAQVRGLRIDGALLGHSRLLQEHAHG